MKRKLFSLILFSLIFLTLFFFATKSSFAVDFICNSCPGDWKCTSGDVEREYSEPLTQNVNQVIESGLPICGTRPASTPSVLCITRTSPTAYAWPRAQGCNTTTQTCDIIAGCIARNSQPPSQCVYASQLTACENDSECPNVNNLCTGYHCIYNGYLLPDSNTELTGTCQYAPNAQQNPNIASNGGTISFNTVDPPCDNCLDEIRTALGFVSTDAAGFVQRILGFVLSISGGILVLIIITAGYKLMTSQGDPEKIKDARERVTSALIGLLFIIFSFVIYQFITSEVLNLPGF